MVAPLTPSLPLWGWRAVSGKRGSSQGGGTRPPQAAGGSADGSAGSTAGAVGT